MKQFIERGETPQGMKLKVAHGKGSYSRVVAKATRSGRNVEVFHECGFLEDAQVLIADLISGAKRYADIDWFTEEQKVFRKGVEQ